MAHDLYADGQPRRRSAHGHDRRWRSQQIEPLRVTHRIKIFDWPPVDDPTSLFVTECRDRAHRTKQQRKFLHLRQQLSANNIAFRPRIQQLFCRERSGRMRPGEEVPEHRTQLAVRVRAPAAPRTWLRSARRMSPTACAPAPGPGDGMGEHRIPAFAEFAPHLEQLCESQV